MDTRPRGHATTDREGDLLAGKRMIGTLEVAVAGLGCNNFGTRLDAARTREVVEAALDAGVTLFDTADLYGDGASEEFLGRALGRRRDDVAIATKFGMRKPPAGLTGGHPDWVARACEQSLIRLGTGHIDLYLFHQPDDDTPIADTLAAMNRLVEEGKVREIGCSNFSAQQIREAQAAAARGPGSARFVSVQNEYSLLHREPEEGVLAECERQGLAFLPFFPLKSGLLTGKYRKGQPIPEDTRVAKYERYRKLLTDENLDKVEVLIEFAESRGHTILELAVSWLLAHRVVASVIAGASSAEQLRANAGAAGWKLTPAELQEIDTLLRADAGKTATT